MNEEKDYKFIRPKNTEGSSSMSLDEELRRTFEARLTKLAEKNKKGELDIGEQEELLRLMRKKGEGFEFR